MEPLCVAVPAAFAGMVLFYRLHWPHRHLLPERFRTMLLAKGIGKAATYLLLTTLGAWLAPELGWALAIGQPALGAVLHVAMCRAHGVDPLRVQPRERYVLASVAWVERLEALERSRGQEHGDGS